MLPRRNLHNRESPWNNPNASTSPPPPSREQSFSETCLLLLDRAPTDRTIEPRLMLITRPPHHRDFSLPSLCPLDNASSFTETIISPLWGGGGHRVPAHLFLHRGNGISSNHGALADRSAGPMMRAHTHTRICRQPAAFYNAKSLPTAFV